MIKSISIDICTDCLMIVANDDDSGIPNPTAHRAAMARLAHGPNAGWDIVIGDGEGSFSTASCDGCGERLAGDRHPAWLVHGG